MTRRSSVVQGRILIAGGGIGGLAAALALAQKGIALAGAGEGDQLGEIGAGIQLGPNAFHCFDRLGVGEAARGMAVYIDKLRLMDAMADGEITHIDLGETFRARFGNPYAVVHRGDLHGVLLKACRDHPLIELRTSAEVDGLRPGRQPASPRSSPTARRVRGAALIGADGLWSNVRRQVVGDGAPRVSGHTTYRSVIPTEQMPEDLRWNAATLWAGPKCHIVHYPLSGWKVFNLVVTYHNDAPEPVAGKPVPVEEVRRGFTHICERAQNIIGHGKDWQHVGAVRPRAGRRTGSTAGWRCWATPPIPCCNTWRRAPAWRWRTRCAWPIRWPQTDTLEAASRPTATGACCARRACSSCRAPWAITSITRPAPHAALRNAIMSAKSQDRMARHARMALRRQRARLTWITSMHRRHQALDCRGSRPARRPAPARPSPSPSSAPVRPRRAKRPASPWRPSTRRISRRRPARSARPIRGRSAAISWKRTMS